MTSPKQISYVFLLTAIWISAFCSVQRSIGQTEAPHLKAAQQRKLDKALEEMRAKHHIPGLAAALSEKGQVIYAKGFGYADLENRTPATELTAFRLASISKPLTAVLALQLVEQGKLDLDAPLNTVLKDLWPKKKWPVTARHLLGHQGGIRHYKRGEFDSTTHYASVADGLAIFNRDPLSSEPGTKYSYSTYGYNLLGGLITKIEKRSFFQLLEKRILRPAGIRHLVVDSSRALIPFRSRHYRLRLGRIENAHLADTSNKIPGGGLRGTVIDLLGFAHAMDRDLLVTPKTKERMWTPMTLKSGEATTYGMGFTVRRVKGKLRVYHTGGQQGTTTVLLMKPESHRAVALMTNLENVPQISDLGHQLLEAVWPEESGR